MARQVPGYGPARDSEIGHAVSCAARRKYASVALTNSGINTFAVAEAEYPLLAALDRRYVSGFMGVIEPEIFRIVREDCGIAPERLRMTGDRAGNIAAAAARGW
ncbi:MAG: hypothetical protein AAGH83_11475 [Pseudomonadota bacterium]